jgi:hypothetical protein
MRLQGFSRLGAGWPPAESTRRKPLVAQPEALRVKHEELYGRRPSVTEDKKRTSEWIVFEFFPANPSKPVHAFAEICRLHRQQYPHLGGDL